MWSKEKNTYDVKTEYTMKRDTSGTVIAGERIEIGDLVFIQNGFAYNLTPKDNEVPIGSFIILKDDLIKIKNHLKRAKYNDNYEEVTKEINNIQLILGFIDSANCDEENIDPFLGYTIRDFNETNELANDKHMNFFQGKELKELSDIANELANDCIKLRKKSIKKQIKCLKQQLKKLKDSE